MKYIKQSYIKFKHIIIITYQILYAGPSLSLAEYHFIEQLTAVKSTFLFKFWINRSLLQLKTMKAGTPTSG